MKCLIPGANVKIFGRAVHSLSKIGDELYLEPLEHGLALRTVNSSRSAYACFIFAPAFFLHYDDGSGQVSSEDSTEVLKCKIGIKSCLSIFKSLSTLEKSVEKCKIRLDEKEARLIFQLHCRHGIMKTYNLSYIECETLQAVFSRDMMPNVLHAQTRLLSDVVVNFQTTQEEVSLIVDPEKACFKNYVDEETDPQKVVHTALSLDPDEFENYQVGIDTEVTFCLKELRAILSFSEPTNQPVSLTFETGGKPIVFAIDSDPSFEANFVLATLARKADSSQPSSQSGSQSVHAPPTTQPRKCDNRTAGHRSQSSTSYTCRPGPSHNSSTQDTLPNRTVKKITSSTKSSMHSSNHEPASVSRRPETSVRASSLPSHGNKTDDANEEENGADGSPVIPVMSSATRSVDTQRLAATSNGVGRNLGQTFADLSSDNETEPEDDDLVPGTPPAKRFRSIFSNLSQSTTSGSQISHSQLKPTPQVLAEDTDDEG